MTSVTWLQSSVFYLQVTITEGSFDIGSQAAATVFNGYLLVIFWLNLVICWSVGFKFQASHLQAVASFGEGHELGVINARCGDERWYLGQWWEKVQKQNPEATVSRPFCMATGMDSKMETGLGSTWCWNVFFNVLNVNFSGGLAEAREHSGGFAMWPVLLKVSKWLLPKWHLGLSKLRQGGKKTVSLRVLIQQSYCFGLEAWIGSFSLKVVLPKLLKPPSSVHVDMSITITPVIITDLQTFGTVRIKGVRLLTCHGSG